MSRRHKLAFAFALIAVLIVTFRYPRLSKSPYRVYVAPDGQHSLEVYAYSSWLPLPSFPGQSGDAPGRVYLKDSKGTTIETMYIDPVQNLREPDWTADGVKHWGVLDWKW